MYLSLISSTSWVTSKPMPFHQFIGKVRIEVFTRRECEIKRQQKEETYLEKIMIIINNIITLQHRRGKYTTMVDAPI
jgi:D-lyxose ketol-isomerase